MQGSYQMWVFSTAFVAQSSVTAIGQIPKCTCHTWYSSMKQIHNIKKKKKEKKKIDPTNWTTTVIIIVWSASIVGSTANCVSPTYPLVIDVIASWFRLHPNFFPTMEKKSNMYCLKHIFCLIINDENEKKKESTPYL
jgi:hypothetical protein